MQTRLVFFFPLLSLALFTTLPAFGSTITVTNTNDSGLGSLRDAIATARSGDTINFSPTLITYPATITLSDKLIIGTSLTISGPGASNLAIKGNLGIRSLHHFKVLVITGGTVSISGVTIENGEIFDIDFGGGIENFGTLTLTNSTVSDNNALPGGVGGGIFNGGTLTLTNSTVSGNNAQHGGGIVNGGTLTLTNSTVSDNSAQYGGGIDNYGGALTLTNSTVSDNSASNGGGILNNATLTITNSTVSGNGADFGGGIDNGGTLTLTNSTVSGNLAAYVGGISGSGLTLKGTILANNYGRPGMGNCKLFGAIIDDGYNLSDDESCSSVLTSLSDRNNTPAGLDPDGLQDNGGPTKTIALLSASPAVDAIPVADCTEVSGNPVTTDQRGVLRPQGSACDIGAFEYATPTSAIQTLTEYVDSLGLPKGEQQNLSSTLGSALSSLNRVQKTAAINQLNTFLNKVSADQKTGKLTYQEATALIQQVQLILQMLGA